MDGGPPPPGVGSGSTVTRYALQTSGSTSQDTLSESEITLPSAWTAPPDAQQPNGERLDTRDGRFGSHSTQIGGSIWNVHTINVGNVARWRLYRFSTTAPTPSFVYTPSAATADTNLFMASVAVTEGASPRAFVTYTRTVPSKGSAGKARMIVSHGPAGSSSGWRANLVAASPTQFASCNAAPLGACEWLHSSTQIDPNTGTQAWSFGQLANGSNTTQWTTRAARVD